mmetsp:Transcript_57262/g.102927  ORF Transcript_57262/g.102927 Transcript_57262/m.102927 type:complete len:218 (+) Transcript_57262:830-1483(+)
MLLSSFAKDFEGAPPPRPRRPPRPMLQVPLQGPCRDEDMTSEMEKMLADLDDCPTQGSFGHPLSCGLSCRWHMSARGCKYGARCPYCHLCTMGRKAGEKMRDKRFPSLHWQSQLLPDHGSLQGGSPSLHGSSPPTGFDEFVPDVIAGASQLRMAEMELFGAPKAHSAPHLGSQEQTESLYDVINMPVHPWEQDVKSYDHQPAEQLGPACAGQWLCQE